MPSETPATATQAPAPLLLDNKAAVAPPMPPLLADASECARVCGGISVRTWWSLHASGRCPLPVRLGRRTLWKIEGPDGLTAWVAANCPGRDRWAAMKGVRL